MKRIPAAIGLLALSIFTPLVVMAVPSHVVTPAPHAATPASPIITTAAPRASQMPAALAPAPVVTKTPVSDASATTTISVPSPAVTSPATPTPTPTPTGVTLQSDGEPVLAPSWKFKRSHPRDPYERKRYLRTEADGSQSSILLYDTDTDSSPAVLASVLYAEMVQSGVPLEKIDRNTQMLCGADAAHIARTHMGGGPDDLPNGDWYFFKRGETTYKLEILYRSTALFTEMRAAAHAVCPVGTPSGHMTH